MQGQIVERNLMVVDETDHPVDLLQRYQQRSLLLMLMRHVGCGLCRQQLYRLREYQQRFHHAHCEIAVIIMGDAKMAHGFRQLNRLPFPVYSDPKQHVYEAFEIGQGSLWTVAGPHVLARQMLLAFKGIPSSVNLTAESIRRLGGIVLLNPQAEISFHHVANPIYRYPTWDEVLTYVEPPLQRAA
ncbi:MAG TPA: hypothetical protein DEF47_02820 [Herpetosiphon sp.]|uniref:Alkyl hydroperoxide reductase subunit C/ Thiol specific antioxidant domain-containing protein n=1 Tax=Herpetosiphon aurantiacus (strain ATCC 23779 / DSM 785 / 114-95) TaxID=316274 RepID=A9AXL7_HERA2|nr:AhpC/TSA family protein [Herpetosiphon sp.]ABX03431.1 hypothetical protein Haur_0783 [Herpetosiphon aurantiacus DSM 785]HBW48823.1 hypothetical protein [Herpetosiphon sp.]